MKAKRQILSLLLVLMMVWQGFSFAMADSNNTSGTAVVGTAGTGSGAVASAASSSVVAGGAVAASGKEIEGALKNPQLLIENKEVNDGDTVSDSAILQFKSDIDISGLAVKDGDYISVQFPAGLKSKDQEFEIPGADGVSIAKGVYDSKTRELKVIFNKNAENYSGGSGSIFFNLNVNTNVIKKSGKEPIEILVNGKKIIQKEFNFTVVGKDDPVSFWKTMDKDIKVVKDTEGKTHYLIRYYVKIDERFLKKNASSTGYDNVVFTDTLKSDALTYFDVRHLNTDLQLVNPATEYTAIMWEGQWRSGDNIAGIWQNAPTDDLNDPARGKSWNLRHKDDDSKDAVKKYFTPVYAADGRSFTYNIGHMNPKDGYQFSYYVEINEAPVNGTVYKNEAKLTGDNITQKPHTRDFIVQEAGGFLNGSNFKIRIKKLGENGEVLKGAKFTVVNPKTKYTKTIISDANGIAKLDNVLMADYVVTEVEAPEGYELDSTAKTISVQDFKDSIRKDATVSLEVVNKKPKVIVKEKNISVKKVWVLDPKLAGNKPEKVVVSVLKNGVKDENLIAELSAANGWKTSFSNLPKEDANGKEIIYTVSEEEVAGFKAAISGTEDTGFTISNYHGSRVVIPVTKIWLGTGSHPENLNVQLFANGEKVATYTLNAANGWQHSFDMPKFDANGKEIRYTVTEDNVAGYTATTENNQATGYVNVFVNRKGEVPPVNPNRGGGGNGGGGGSTPRNTPSNPTPSGNNPRGGEVLNADRTPAGNPDVVTAEGAVLGAERETQKSPNPGAVLGAERGQTKTGDASQMRLYFALFALAGLGFSYALVLNKKRSRR